MLIMSIGNNYAVQYRRKLYEVASLGIQYYKPVQVLPVVNQYLCWSLTYQDLIVEAA